MSYVTYTLEGPVTDGTIVGPDMSNAYERGIYQLFSLVMLSLLLYYLQLEPLPLKQVSLALGLAQLVTVQ